MALSIGELVGYIDLDTSKAESAAGSIGGMLEKVGGTWGKVLGAAGAAGGLLYGAGLVGAMDAEVGSDMLAASVGGGTKLAERYGDIAGRVYSNGFGAGLEDVNTAMGAVVTSIKGMRSASDKEVRSMTEKAMTYADVMGIDVTRAAQVAGNMVANGMAKNGSQAFDLLMKASQRVPVQLREDVLDATDEYGQFFSMLGIKGPQALGMLAAGAEKGMYGIDKAGDAVKEFTIRATDGSKATTDAYKSMGMDARKMSNEVLAGGTRANKATSKIIDGLLGIKDPTQQAATAIALFGTPLEDIGVKDIPTFLSSLKNGEKGLGNFKGAVDKAGQTAYDNASTNLSMFGRTLKTEFVETIGGSVLPKVTELTGSLNDSLGPAFDVAGDAAKATTGWLKDHEGVAKTLAGVIGGLVAVTAAHSAVLAVSAAGGMAAWLKGTRLISGATKVWTAIQWAMNAALAANPLVLIGVLLAALVVGLVVAYKKSDTFREVVDKAFRAVGEAGKWLWENAIKPAFEKMKDGFEAVGKAGTWLWNNALQPAFKFIVGGLASILDMWAGMLSTLAKVPGFGWAKDAADAMANAADKARGVADGIKKIPTSKTVAVTVAYKYTGLKSPTRGRDDDFSPRMPTSGRIAAKAAKGGRGAADAFMDAYDAEYAKRTGKAGKGGKAAKARAKKLLDDARDGLREALDLRNQFRAAARDSAAAFGSVVNTIADEAGAITGQSAVAQMRERLSAIRTFRDNMAALLKKGLDKASYQQMIESGVEQSGALAAALVKDDAAAKAVADLSGQIGSAANGLAQDASEYLYQAGVDSAQALVNSLTSKQPELDEQARLVGDGMGRSLVAGMMAALAEAGLSDVLQPAGKGDPSKGRGKDRDKGRDKDKGKNGRNAPLIGQVVQRPGESAESFAERMWLLTRTRG